MAGKSISRFRAEYGIKLAELSEKTGISEQELKNIDNVMPVPYDAEQIIIEKYALPNDYFTGDVIIKREKGFNAFLLVSVVWYFVIIITAFLPKNIMLSVGLNFFNANIELVNAIGLIYNAVAVIICCILFTKYLGKKYGFSADKNKYMFLYYLVPNGMLSVITMISEAVYTSQHSEDTQNAILGALMNSVFSFIAGVGSIFLLAKMLKCICDSDEKGNKTLKAFYIVYGINAVIGIIFTVIYTVLQGEFDLTYILANTVYYAAALAIAVGLFTKKCDESETAEKVFCCILPIFFLFISPVMSVVNVFI